jgi:hypothetical protein
MDRPTRRASINRTLEFGSALPVSRLMMPMRTSLFPTSGDPVIAATLADVVAGSPNMCVISPLPKSRRPNETDARFRHDLDAHRRRGHIDIDPDSDRKSVV